MDGNLNGKTLSPNEALAMMEQILGALGELHAKGLIHGDLKPDNILYKIDNGKRTFKLSDFGSTIENDSRPDTKSALYAAPEEGAQSKKRTVTYETDIYKIFLIYGETLTGSQINGKTLDEAIDEDKFNPYLRELQGLFSIGTHQNRKRRFKSTNETLAAIKKAHERGITALEEEEVVIDLDQPFVPKKENAGRTSETFTKPFRTKPLSSEDLTEVLPREKAGYDKTKTKALSAQELDALAYESNLALATEEMKRVMDLDDSFLMNKIAESMGVKVANLGLVKIVRNYIFNRYEDAIRANVTPGQFEEYLLMPAHDEQLLDEFLNENLAAFPFRAQEILDDTMEIIQLGDIMFTSINYDLKQLDIKIANLTENDRVAKLNAEDKDSKLRLLDKAREEAIDLLSKAQSDLEEEIKKHQNSKSQIDSLNEALERSRKKIRELEESQRDQGQDQQNELREKDARIRELEAKLRQITSSTARDNPQNRQTPFQPSGNTRTLPLPEEDPPVNRLAPITPTPETDSPRLTLSDRERARIREGLGSRASRQSTRSPEKRKFRSPITIRRIMGVGFLASIAFMGDFLLSAVTDDELMEQRRRNADVDGKKYIMEHIEKRWSQLGNFIGFDD